MLSADALTLDLVPPARLQQHLQARLVQPPHELPQLAAGRARVGAHRQRRVGRKVADGRAAERAVARRRQRHGRQQQRRRARGPDVLQPGGTELGTYF